MRNWRLASFILVMTVVSYLLLCGCGAPKSGASTANQKMYHYQNMEECPYGGKDWQYNRANAGNDGRDVGEAREIRRGFTNPKTIEEALGLHRRADSAAVLKRSGHKVDR